VQKRLRTTFADGRPGKKTNFRAWSEF